MDYLSKLTVTVMVQCPRDSTPLGIMIASPGAALRATCACGRKWFCEVKSVSAGKAHVVISSID